MLTCRASEAGAMRGNGLESFHRIDHASPKGFGANHNAAFRYCDSPYSCVENSDVRLVNEPFPALIACMDDPKAGLVAPRVIDAAGNWEDCARYFPAPSSLAARMFQLDDGCYPAVDEAPMTVDWVDGRRSPHYRVWNLSSVARYFSRHQGRLPHVGQEL